MATEVIPSWTPRGIGGLHAEAMRRWHPAVGTAEAPLGGGWALACEPGALPLAAGWLFGREDVAFAGLVVEEGEAWTLRYLFHGTGAGEWMHLVVRQPLAQRELPSISGVVHAADWHEREAEDLFGLIFEGHPRLGDFVLHDDIWQEDLAPMRHSFAAAAPVHERWPNPDWRPRRILHERGSFSMPIGPVFAGPTESVHFLLETAGEDVVRTVVRLFFKYRAVEKIAEGRGVAEVLLLAERFAATTAFAHSLAYCQAVETLAGRGIPERAAALRVLVAELERLRHHAGAIEGICESTGLAVAAAQAAIVEEDLLRVCGRLTGHRYLFGLNVPGGLAMDLPDEACGRAAAAAGEAFARLARLEEALRFSSSYLDRLEEVGIVTPAHARAYGLVGPVGRASAVARDLRRVQPYAAYGTCDVPVVAEIEGDGYARLRVLFREAAVSAALVETVARRLPGGPCRIALGEIPAGAALGWTEAPRGAAFHWVRVEGGGRVSRYRIVPPSFTNWHAFHLAAEDFAFQDFPIILATFGLSVAESDR